MFPSPLSSIKAIKNLWGDQRHANLQNCCSKVFNWRMEMRHYWNHLPRACIFTTSEEWISMSYIIRIIFVFSVQEGPRRHFWWAVTGATDFIFSFTLTVFNIIIWGVLKMLHVIIFILGERNLELFKHCVMINISAQNSSTLLYVKQQLYIIAFQMLEANLRNPNI